MIKRPLPDALAPDLRGIDAATADEWRELNVSQTDDLVRVADLPRIIARAIALDRARRIREAAARARADRGVAGLTL